MNIKISRDVIIGDFKKAIMEIDSLKDFFEVYVKAVNLEEKDFLDKYKYGIAIADALDSVYMEKSYESQKSKLEKVKDERLANGLLVKDVIHIVYSEDEADNNAQIKLSFSLLDRYDYKYYNPEISRRKKSMFQEQRRMFAQSILSNLIIIFESYLAKVYEILVITCHKSYLDNKQIYVSEIFNRDLGEIIHSAVRNEVEQNMYDSLKTLDKMKCTSGFDIDRYIPIRKKFEEIYYRRNIYVHNSGKVNEIYLSKVDKKYQYNAELNNYLSCDDEYLLSAIRIVKKVVCSLYYELLNTKIFDNNIPYGSLSNVGFEALCSKEYSIAEHIYNSLSKHKGFEYIDKAAYQANYINALKQQGVDIEKLIDEYDVSIATDDFKIAKLCLQDRFEDVYELLVKSYPESFDAIALREWPIFVNFRDTEFYEKFKASHKADFKEFVFEENSMTMCDILDDDNIDIDVDDIEEDDIITSDVIKINEETLEPIS